MRFDCRVQSDKLLVMAREVEQIKERLSIEDVVGSYVKLEKAGVNLRARCPFHSEKTPSFFVSLARNSFYCFGCGAKGDIFSFVEQFEGLDFLGALTLLAERAGVALSRQDPKQDDERQKLLRILEEAAQWYVQELQTAPEAREYLRERGVSEATAEKFLVGFAPPKWRALSEHLRRKGFPDRLLSLSGLTKETERGIYDRFRGRIMFPINDSAGRIVAFSGRLFGERPPRAGTVEGEEAKYVNSPETPLFSKSRILYGFDMAKTAIRRNDFSIVVEGQMDLLLSHQAGFGNSVALSGTALTLEQITLLKRLSLNTVFAFDADRAGVLSSGRSASLALSLGMNVKVAALPKGADPADLILKDPELWKKVIRESEHIIDFYLGVLSAEEGDLRTFRLRVQQNVLPFVARIGNRIDQAHFISRIASRLNLAEEPIREELRKLPASADTSASAGAGVPAPLAVSPLSRHDLISRKLIGLLLWQEHLPMPAIDTRALREKLLECAESAVLNATAASDEVREELLFEAEAAYADTGSLAADVSELVRELSILHLRQALRAATEELRRAEGARDERAVQELLLRVKDIAAAVSAFSSRP